MGVTTFQKKDYGVLDKHHVTPAYFYTLKFYAAPTLDGANLTTDGNPPGGGTPFNKPQGVAYSSITGYIYIADTNNNRIVIMNASTSAYVNSLGPGFGLNGPTGLKVDNATPPNIYVADSGNHRVVVFSP